MAIAFTCTGPIIEWRGPAPFYFVALSEDDAAMLTDLGPAISYGWGCIPVEVTLGATRFTTSLIPRNGGFLVPLKVAVRTAAQVDLGDVVRLDVEVVS